MAEVVNNKMKANALTAYASGRTFKAMLLKTVGAGWNNPDLASVAAMLAVGGVAEADFTNYTRLSLASVTITQDDTNDRANMDAANLTNTNAGGATNNTPAAMVIIDCTVDTNDSTRTIVASYDTNFATVSTNGANWVVNISDFIRAT